MFQGPQKSISRCQVHLVLRVLGGSTALGRNATRGRPLSWPHVCPCDSQPRCPRQLRGSGSAPGNLSQRSGRARMEAPVDLQSPGHPVTTIPSGARAQAPKGQCRAGRGAAHRERAQVPVRKKKTMQNGGTSTVQTQDMELQARGHSPELRPLNSLRLKNSSFVKMLNSGLLFFLLSSENASWFSLGKGGHCCWNLCLRSWTALQGKGTGCVPGTEGLSWPWRNSAALRRKGNSRGLSPPWCHQDTLDHGALAPKSTVSPAIVWQVTQISRPVS